MGRPRKRQKTDDSPPANLSRNRSSSTSVRPLQPATPIVQQISWDADVLDPSLSAIQVERAQTENICNGPMAKTVRDQTSAYQHVQTGSLEESIPVVDDWDSAGTAYPTDFAKWPDFSTLDMLPLPVEDKYSAMDPIDLQPYDPDANPEALNNLPAIPACPCLPNLYLTLSTLSTLKSFPFTKQTINTIESSYKTARGVIYCNVCPQKFDTGSSNLMLGTTLLNVLADQWNRFRNLSVDELKKAFGNPAQQNTIVTTKEGRAWRDFQKEVLEAYVFGDQAVPHPPGCANSPGRSVSSLETDDTCNANVPALTLMGLCDSLERRQKQWHRLEEPTDEFPDRVSNDLQMGHLVGNTTDVPGKHLCLEIVNHAKCIVKSLKGSTSHCSQ